MTGKDSKPKPGKSKKTPPAAAPLGANAVDERRAARNVENIRNKLSSAMDDPHMRAQIVRAMRDLINEDKS